MSNNMIFKLIVLSVLLVAFASAAPQGHYHHEEEEHHDHPKYTFSYKVANHKTGDIKSQYETRDGDKVHGSYSLVEPDGSLRIVKYTSNKHNGFRATVETKHYDH